MQIPPVNLTPVVTPPAPVGKQQEAQTAPEEESRVFSPVDETDETNAKPGLRESPEKAKEQALDVLVARRDGSDDPAETDSENAGVPTNSRSAQSAEQDPREALQLAELARRDREVRNHEQAHASVGGALASAATYQYTIGPDGRRYATAGEVSISTGSVSSDPRQAIVDAERIQRAALAPANPSLQDRRVASQAVQMKLDATRELAEQSREARNQEELERSEAREQRLSAQQVDQERTEARKAREEQAAELRERQLEQAQLQQERLSRANQDLVETYSALRDFNRNPGDNPFIDTSA
ncbi:hypothetical protein MIB92_04675 [Aestuariirhabdus sp. Z084]|uniref:putative metalloprotease CJM1_0395 family protein n=1 Tax=Aestuariirhabdus haliotis TaxID=2918751 RepID=UPI00201B4006|nr:putative metalloprotease CJM1_0395 family protein [Aestuariirhabdus haliotis]MCL6414934.1 hypothetical protein [Aestuariirhabdus haliotis]MCL6418866.1 hypothetical protein [Aestuariirhabdus haliotis]